MVNESRNGVDGGYSILVGVEPNDAPRWGQSGSRELTNRWQVYQKLERRPVSTLFGSCVDRKAVSSSALLTSGP